MQKFPHFGHKFWKEKTALSTRFEAVIFWRQFIACPRRCFLSVSKEEHKFMRVKNNRLLFLGEIWGYRLNFEDSWGFVSRFWMFFPKNCTKLLKFLVFGKKIF
jgi:hypothetical protein